MPKTRYARRRFSRNSGITRVEMLNLEKDCVMTRKDPDEDGNWVISSLSAGLSGGPANGCSRSTKSRSRCLSAYCQSQNVGTYSASRHPDRKLEPCALESEMVRFRARCFPVRYRSLPADPPSLPNPHRQSFLAIQPVHPLMVCRHSCAHPPGVDERTALAIRSSIGNAFVFGFRLIAIFCALLATASAVVAWRRIPAQRPSRAQDFSGAQAAA